MYITFLLQVSVGTLLAFTMVAMSVLILRYIPPNEVPLAPSLKDSIASVLKRYSLSSSDTNVGDVEANTSEHRKPLIVKEDVSIDITEHSAGGNRELSLSFSFANSFNR